jgi:hypothetical protein
LLIIALPGGKEKYEAGVTQGDNTKNVPLFNYGIKKGRNLFLP